eukprot:6214816-Pleurochrysis_carterae.AAC.3
MLSSVYALQYSYSYNQSANGIIKQSYDNNRTAKSRQEPGGEGKGQAEETQQQEQKAVKRPKAYG